MIYFWFFQSSLLCRLFFGCAEQGLLPSHGAWALHCGGFSCGAQGSGCVGLVLTAPRLESTCLVLVVLGLVAPQPVGSDRPRD